MMPLLRGWFMAACFFCGTSYASPPAWWTSGNPPVIDPNAPINHKGPANIGQAKWMAKNALDALRAVSDSTADAVEIELVGPGKPIPSWDAPSNPTEQAAMRAPLLIGQLKAISAPFYEKLNTFDSAWLENERILNETAISGTYFPWTPETSDDANKAVANIGQLKAVFSLRFESLVPVENPALLADSDGDRIPDLWEVNRNSLVDDENSAPVVDVTVDGGRASDPALNRYATMQEAYEAVPTVVPGTSTPYYSVIVVKPGTYTGKLSSNALKKVLWLADTANGLVTLNSADVAVLLNDTTVMDGFVISGNGSNTDIGISVVPHPALTGTSPKIRIVNSVVVSRWSTAENSAGIVNNGGDLSLVHCTIVDNLGGTTNGKAKAITNLGGTINLVNSIVGQQSITTNPLIPPVWTEVSPAGVITTSGTIIKDGAGQWDSTNVDPALSRLWHLSAGDPAVSFVRQKGVENSGVKTDIYGRLRPQTGVAPDLGAEQWVDHYVSAPNLEIFAITTDSVSLAWNDVDHEHGYRIERSTDGVNFTEVVALSANATSYVDTSLPQDTAYYYRIIAEHPQQDSAPSDVIVVYLEVVAPTSVSATDGTSNSIKVSWNHGTNQTHYLVQASASLPGDSWSDWVDVASVSKGITSVIVNNLVEKTRYRVRVAAVNPWASAYSSGDPATTSVAAEEETTAAIPSAPSNLRITAADATSANLSWNDTADNETAYKVEYSVNGGSTWTSLISSLSADVNTYNAGGLASTSDYRFRVTAVNEWAGSIVESVHSNEVDLPAMPIAPSNVSAVPQGLNGIYVNWSLPVDPTRTTVRIQSFKVGDANPRLSVNLGPAISSYADSGLLAATGYSYQIFCINARGEASGNIPIATTLQELPLAPTITTTVLGPRSVKLDWADIWNSETRFTVERSAVASTGPWTVLAELPASSGNSVSYADNNGLKGATLYYYRVKVTNAYGSTYSQAVAATTANYPAINNAPDAMALNPNGGNLQLAWNRWNPGQLFYEHDVTAERLGSLWIIKSTWQGKSVPYIWDLVPEPDVGLAPVVPSGTFDSSEEYGSKVVVSGSRIFIAAPNALKIPGNASSGRCGAVYVFEWNGTNASGVARLVPSNGAVGDRFGDSLAADGDRLIIGAPKRDITTSSTTYTDAGMVYLCERSSSGEWNLTRSESPTLPENFLNFGTSVAIRGRHFVVGAPNQDNNDIPITTGSSTTTYDLADAGALYFGKWTESAGRLVIMANPLISEVAAVNHSSITGIGGSHFGKAVTLDLNLTITCTAPDHTWASTNTAMTPFAGGNVFKIFWNGALGDAWIARPGRLPLDTTFNQKLGLTAKWDPVTQWSNITSGSGPGVVCWSVSTAIGNEAGKRAAFIEAQEPDGDPVTYEVIQGGATGGLWGTVISSDSSQFEIQQEGNEFYLASKAGAGLSAGSVYSARIRISDDRGGTKDIPMLVRITGSSSNNGDADNDGMNDSWEISHGLNPADPSDAALSRGGDGLTSREKYLRYLSGMTYGINPNKWDLNPNGDEDGDGVLNKLDAHPFDPEIKALSIEILQPGNLETY